ncbi:hypothetical protein D1872_81900 [compost metagenome]
MGDHIGREEVEEAYLQIYRTMTFKKHKYSNSKIRWTPEKEASFKGEIRGYKEALRIMEEQLGINQKVRRRGPYPAPRSANYIDKIKGK